MKIKIMFLNLVFSLSLLSLSACSIEGEQIGGISHTTENDGTMPVAIPPKDDNFVKKLLNNNTNRTNIVSKPDDFHLIADLEVKDATDKAMVNQEQDKTKKQTTFHVIGIQELVAFDDFKAIEKAIEALWANAYNEDFSAKLQNILEPNNRYVCYSNYDQPKGKMTITLACKVKDLSNIPSGLKGLKIPSNAYLVDPISNDLSDDQGAVWTQLEELMTHRKMESVDFEVYTFDNNYKVKQAEIWIATQ